MIRFRGSIFIIACLILKTSASPELTVQEKAFYVSESNCAKLGDGTTGPLVLFTGSHVTLVGRAKKIENTYGPNNERYSMTVTPQCIQKGDVSHDEIVVRNLGKTKCGRSDVEVGKDYVFFLRRTSDPKVYKAMNEGVHLVEGSMLWSPFLTILCGVKQIQKCKDESCPAGCRYEPPDDVACVPLTDVANDTFSVLYGKERPTSTTSAMTSTQTRVDNNVVQSSETPSTVKSMSTSAVQMVEVSRSRNGQQELKFTAALTLITCFIALLAGTQR